MVQAVLIRSKLVRGFFRPGEERSDSVQVEPEQERIVRGDLEFFGDTIPDSKYLDSITKFESGWRGKVSFVAKGSNSLMRTLDDDHHGVHKVVDRCNEAVHVPYRYVMF